MMLKLVETYGEKPTLEAVQEKATLLNIDAFTLRGVIEALASTTREGSYIEEEDYPLLEKIDNNFLTNERERFLHDVDHYFKIYTKRQSRSRKLIKPLPKFDTTILEEAIKAHIVSFAFRGTISIHNAEAYLTKTTPIEDGVAKISRLLKP